MVRSRTEPASRTPVVMLATIAGVQLTAAMVVLGIPALTPALRQEFSLSRGAAGLLMTAAFLGVVVASWPAGRVVNAVGVRRSMVVASVGLGASFALTGVAWSWPATLAVLFVVGVFYSPVTPATNAGVVAWAPSAFRTRAMAAKQMGVTAGASASAALIPVLATHFGWRTAVVVVGALAGAIGLVLASRFRRPPEVRAATHFGPLENRPLVVLLGAAAFCLIFVQHSVATHFILALQDQGASLIAAGGALSLLQLSATGARFGWAWVVDGPLRGNATLGILVLCLGSALVLGAMTALDGARAPIVAAILLGATTQAGNGLMQLVIADAGGPAPAASSGLGMSIGFSGTVLGPPLFGYLADLWTYRSSWVALAAVALVAGILTWSTARSARH